MGGAQSSERGHGYHVLRVQENSPAYLAGIEPFFDYIAGINGIPLNTQESRILQDQLLSNVDKEVILAVYSTKEQELREIAMIPNRNWTSNPGDGLIGCSIRFCAYEATNEHVWHILDVSPNSPAELAGLIPHTDYIIGTPRMTLHNESDFYNLVEQHLGHRLRLCVYNSVYDACREVVITPSHDWGGEGVLGCGVGYGYLHRIPKTNKFHGVQQQHSSALSIDKTAVPLITTDYNHSTIKTDNVGIQPPSTHPPLSSLSKIVEPPAEPIKRDISGQRHQHVTVEDVGVSDE